MFFPHGVPTPTLIGGNDANTKLLLQCNGTDGSTTFTDSSGSSHSPSAVGNAQIDTAIKRFGTGSMLLDGTGDRVTVPASNDFDQGTNDFTIDCWVYRTNNVEGGLFEKRQTGDFTVEWYITSGGNPSFRVVNGTGPSGNKYTREFTLSIPLNEWKHVAIERSGSTTLDAYVDGVKEDGSAGFQNDGNFGSFNATIEIGRRAINTGEFQGHIDEFRYSNTARYGSANFNPPLREYD